MKYLFYLEKIVFNMIKNYTVTIESKIFRADSYIHVMQVENMYKLIEPFFLNLFTALLTRGIVEWVISLDANKMPSHLASHLDLSCLTPGTIVLPKHGKYIRP